MNGDHFLLGAKIALGLFAAFCVVAALWTKRQDALRNARAPKPFLRVYIAGGSSERLDIVRPLIARAKDLGVKIVHDWTRDPNWDITPFPPTDGQFRESARRDLDAIRRADIVWLVVPKAKSEGASVELGYAMALGKRIIVSGDVGPRNIFAMLAHEVDTFHGCDLDGAMGDHEEALEHMARLSQRCESRTDAKAS